MKRKCSTQWFVRLTLRTVEDRNAPAIFGPIDNTVTVGTQPQSIAVADFNGDGHPDFAVANINGNQLSILLGSGSGGFSPATGSPIAINRPYFVAAGDFNGDGKQDLAVANNFGAAGTVTVLLGDGSGGFSQSVVGNGDSLVSVAVGNLNGDGKLDIAATNNVTGGGVTVLLGNGNGTFTPATGSPLAAGNGPCDVAVGDFNGDGKEDLAITSSAVTTSGSSWVTGPADSLRRLAPRSSSGLSRISLQWGTSTATGTRTWPCPMLAATM
jgi:hypothetical protein